MTKENLLKAIALYEKRGDLIKLEKAKRTLAVQYPITESKTKDTTKKVSPGA